MATRHDVSRNRVGSEGADGETGQVDTSNVYTNPKIDFMFATTHHSIQSHTTPEAQVWDNNINIMRTLSRAKVVYIPYLSTSNGSI